MSVGDGIFVVSAKSWLLGSAIENVNANTENDFLCLKKT